MNGGIIVFTSDTPEQLNERLEGEWVHKNFKLPSKSKLKHLTTSIGEISGHIIARAIYTNHDFTNN